MMLDLSFLIYIYIQHEHPTSFTITSFMTLTAIMMQHLCQLYRYYVYFSLNRLLFYINPIKLPVFNYYGDVF